MAGATPPFFSFDIDDFKKVNDTYGHLFGDEVLRRISAQLGAMLRMEEGEFAARYGGEEFIYVFRAASFEEAIRRADDIREAINNTTYDEFPGVHVSISEGLVSFAQHGDVNILLRTADELLYQAKAEGKNRVKCLQVQ